MNESFAIDCCACQADEVVSGIGKDLETAVDHTVLKDNGVIPGITEEAAQSLKCSADSRKGIIPISAVDAKAELCRQPGGDYGLVIATVQEDPETAVESRLRLENSHHVSAAVDGGSFESFHNYSGNVIADPDRVIRIIPMNLYMVAVETHIDVSGQQCACFE
jgi:hypothetical protein